MTQAKHSITKLKPPSERVTILEKTIAKKSMDLGTAKEKRDWYIDHVRQLQLELQEAEVALVVAKQAKAEQE
eukprot:8777273-Karenia_brevis.AAC.1